MREGERVDDQSFHCARRLQWCWGSRLHIPRKKIPEFKPLFNGKDLTGWKHVGPGEMTVEDGLIHTHGGMGLLYWTGGKLGNCRIRVVFKMKDHNSNSGVFIRIPIEPREPWMPVHYGYEVQIDNEPETSKEDEYHATGTLYSLTKPANRPGKPGPEWNTMLITLDGPRTVVTVNDQPVTDYTEGQPVPEKKFDFEPQRGKRPNEGYYRAAKPRRPRHRVLQGSERPAVSLGFWGIGAAHGRRLATGTRTIPGCRAWKRRRPQSLAAHDGC